MCQQGATPALGYKCRSQVGFPPLNARIHWIDPSSNIEPGQDAHHLAHVHASDEDQV